MACLIYCTDIVSLSIVNELDIHQIPHYMNNSLCPEYTDYSLHCLHG